MKKNLLRSLFLVMVFFLAGFFLINHLSSSPLYTPSVTSPFLKGEVGERLENIKYIKIAGQVIKVELALTTEEQALGLSGRPGLNNNEGMLFVFPQLGNYSFWMKDMNFPIDIIWIDENLQVVYIKKDARPELYPETYGPKEYAKYVLEVVSGFSDKNNLQIGDKIENFVSP